MHSLPTFKLGRIADLHATDHPQITQITQICRPTEVPTPSIRQSIREAMTKVLGNLSKVDGHSPRSGRMKIAQHLSAGKAMIPFLSP